MNGNDVKVRHPPNWLDVPLISSRLFRMDGPYMVSHDCSTTPMEANACLPRWVLDGLRLNGRKADKG